jgi:hypothetical protein
VTSAGRHFIYSVSGGAVEYFDESSDGGIEYDGSQGGMPV